MTQDQWLDHAKAVQRTAAEARRARVHSPQRSSIAAARLSEVLQQKSGRVLAGYIAMRSEADPAPALAAHAGPVCLPVVVARAQPLRFRAWPPGADLVPGGFGTLIPASGGWLEPDLLIVPLLAFDRYGFRLGYGGGYYDRTLAALRAARGCVAIGYGYAAQEVTDLPVAAHDAPLDLIVTEDEVIQPG